jgi:hypothetical protein
MTATTVSTGRQSVLSADRSFNYEDFTSGVTKPMIYVRHGTRILRGWVDITTAWNNTSSASVTVGDTEGTDDVDRWLAATVSIKAKGLTALLAPLNDSVIDTAEAITMTVTTSGTGNAGAGVLHIEYIEEPRVTELNPVRQ